MNIFNYKYVYYNGDFAICPFSLKCIIPSLMSGTKHMMV